jgi:hypothetical protein
MKNIVLAFLLLAVIGFVRADDGNVLKNGDFSEGISHWEGDCHTPENGSDASLTSTPTTGVIVKLRGSDWTKVMQDFEGKMGEYLLSITYSVSPDLKFSDRADDYVNVANQLGFSRLSPFDSDPGKWVIIINDVGANHYTFWKIMPKNDASSPQTVTCRVHVDAAQDDLGFYIVFPPGTGAITLKNISLVPKQLAVNP